MKFILIGDSIRMGYQPTVRRLIGSRVEIWEPETNGGDSSNVLAHLDEWVLNRKPDLVHVNCGLHDLRLRPDRTYQVPIEQYVENVTAIADRLVDALGHGFIWARTTPVLDARQTDGGDFRRYDRDVVRYNKAADTVMSDRSVRVNDLYSVVMDADIESIMKPDGIHYTEAGYDLLGRAVANTLADVKGW